MDKLSGNLETDERIIRQGFKDCDDIVARRFYGGKNREVKLFLIYTDNIVNGQTVREAIMTNLMNRCAIENFSAENILRRLNEETLAVGEMKEIETFDDIFYAVLNGDTVIIADGCKFALQASTKGYPTRGVPEAETEVVVQGPKDAFTEASSTNIVLIRRRIKDAALKVKRQKIGVRTKTDVAVMYMEGIIRKDILKNITEKLNNIEIDGILDSGYLSQLIEKSVASPFPQIQMTERPDKAAAALLEGRAVLVVDNTPFVIMLPSTLNQFFQSAEDYYDRWEIMSFLRFMRYVAVFLAVALPGFYIATALYNPSSLPTTIALKIAQSRQNVPLPTATEIIIMELAFELLREAGVRLPSPVSSTIGIVGGIIIGQAAVDAGLVSPSAVIISALTGICTFVIPNNSLVSGIRLSKYIVIALSATLGLLGFWFSAILIISHLAALESFGAPYTYPYCSSQEGDYDDFKDSLFRLPIFTLKKRPAYASPKQRVKQKGGRDR